MNLPSLAHHGPLLASFLALVGCTTVGKNDPAQSEEPFAAQVANVRSGKTDQIQVEQVTLRDDELRELAELQNLRVLLLDHPGCRFSGEGLRQLTGLKKLQHLRIRGGEIDGQALVQITKIESLKVLNLPRATFAD